MANLPRGVRNNNPGNIDYNPRNQWEGQLGPEIGVPKPRFARFDSPENGIRALGKLIRTYQNKHGLKTVEQIIGRWAPNNENNTKAYAEAVAKALSVTPWANIDVNRVAMLRPLVEAIIRHENGGNPYVKGEIDEGVRRALA
ncbi:MAG: structural protein [Pseudomonadales bacterium]